MYFTPWDEKRRAFRLKSSLPIHYDSSSDAASGATLTQDISEGGVSMLCEEFIPRLSRMSVQINLLPNKLVAATGEVKWAQRIAHSYRYQVGLEFKDIGSDDRRSISEYVASHR